jgi:hypothetical protein
MNLSMIMPWLGVTQGGIACHSQTSQMAALIGFMKGFLAFDGAICLSTSQETPSASDGSAGKRGSASAASHS